LRYLGVIPARGGSKRIPGKNVKLICGKPLIYWTIRAAQESRLLDDFVVSTDSGSIANVAEGFGARVLMRPKRLARDDTPMVPVLEHALRIYQSDVVVLLQPTSPIRLHGIVDRCIGEFDVHQPDLNSLSTGFMCKCYEWGTVEDLPSQSMRGWFYNDGCVEVHHRDIILRGRRFGKKRMEVLNPPYMNIEIDNLTEWFLVEDLMRLLGYEEE
jgi:N-acylneuraminate cytidylyltransferase